MSNLSIVQSFYEGTVEERGEKLASSVSPEVVWQESEGYLYGGRYVGLQEVFEGVFLRQATEWTGFRSEAEEFVAQDNSVIALGFYEGTHNETQRSFRARFAHHWTLKEGKVVRFVQYVDSHTVWKAAHSS